MRWILFSFVLLSLAAQAPVVAAAPPTLITRLVQASDELEKSDPALDDLYKPLKKVVGFERYEQLQRRVTVLKPNTPVRAKLGKDFRVEATYFEKTDKGHRIKIHWASGKTVIASESQILRAGQPLLIKGPEVGKTWIILAVEVRE